MTDAQVTTAAAASPALSQAVEEEVKQELPEVQCNAEQEEVKQEVTLEHPVVEELVSVEEQNWAVSCGPVF